MENDSALVVTNFGERHEKISDGFKKRLIQYLQDERCQTKTYGIDTETYGNGEQESIKITLGDNITLTLQVTTRR